MTEFGGQSDVAPLRRLLLKHARDAFSSQDAIDAQWQELGYAAPPDLRAAVSEYDALVELLQSLGVHIQLFPEDSSTGLDSLYVRDASVVTNRGVILCKMGKVARASEPAAQGAALEEMGIPVLGEISGDGRLEGGDVVWLDEHTVAVGRGYRTNREGIRQLTELLGDGVDQVVVVPLPHWKGPSDVFHLMSVLSPLDRDLVLVYSPLLPVPFREELLDQGFSLVEVPDKEFESMGCNVLSVAPRVCVALEGNPVTRSRLEEAGVTVHTYRGDEISRKGSGGPTCLTRPVLREVEGT